jgi:hypothetical protein
MPDLFAQREIPSDAVKIVELVDPIGVRFLAQPACGLNHLKDEVLSGAASLAWYEHQVRTQCPHMIPLFLAKGV